MVGNDIVDLNFAKNNCRWQEQRFLDKIFTINEQKFILRDENRFQNTWLLWSMKESAFKIASRLDSGINFNPKAFHCLLESPNNNVVRFANNWYQTSTVFHKNFIYTTASHTDKMILTKWLQFNSNIPSFQSLDIREACLIAYSNLKAISKSEITIRNNKHGVPSIYVDDCLQKETISMTHHGNFGGFAIAG